MDEEEKRLAEELLFSEEKKPSFAKQLFVGAFDSSQLLPFPFPEKEEKEAADAYVEKVRQFAVAKIDAAAIDKEAKIPDDVIRGLAELQVLGMTVPKEYGGLGMSQYAYCRVTEELARHCASTALYVNVHQSIGLKSLLLFGTEAQKKRWLPPLAKGEITAAFSLTEPNAGSDAAGIETTAEYLPDQKAYRINGCKQWTTSGGIARILTVMAKTEEKITAFLVPADTPGFKVKERALEKVGMRGTWTANLAFQDMIVPEENILGQKGKGLKVALTILDFGRTTFGSTCLGAAKELVKRALDHAVHRVQFHKPLAAFPMIKKKLALMSAYLFAIESTTYMTAGMIDRGLEDFMLETAMLKVFASEAEWQILYDTMQIFGGRSFFTDEPFERVMRDSRLNMIGEGANEVLRVFIGAVGIRDAGIQLKEMKEALFEPFSHFDKLYSLGKHVLGRMQAPAVPVKSPLLQAEADRLSRSIGRFGRAVLSLLFRYKESIVDKQLQLNRLTTAAIALYTTSAVLSRLDYELFHAQGSSGVLVKDLETGKLYCRLALQKAKRHLENMAKNEDASIESLSDLLTGIH